VIGCAIDAQLFVVAINARPRSLATKKELGGLPRTIGRPKAPPKASHRQSGDHRPTPGALNVHEHME
jgi:hypothetical protein